MDYRTATRADVPLLARMNQQLIRDEKHRNQMTLPELEERMAGFLAGQYEAVLFSQADRACGYALFRREPDDVYIRQLYVDAEFRRQGIGRAAIEWLVVNRWAKAPRVRMDVLVDNERALAFWRAVGFEDYCITLERPVGAVTRSTPGSR
jgi:ribosomal protein S18 acetylase RimI-like enzyme